MVAARFRNDVVAHPLRKCRNLSMKRRAFRIDGAHHATTIIATGGNGIEQRFMQPLNDGPKAIFQHPMILKSLPRRQPQRLAAMRARQFVHFQPLRRRADAAGQAHADHELISRLQLLTAALVAQFAVILLIDAVKFHQLDVVSTRHRTSDAVEQAFCDGAAQIIALRLHRSEEHTSELQSLTRNSYAVFCLKQKNTMINNNTQVQYRIPNITTVKATISLSKNYLTTQQKDKINNHLHNHPL